MRTSIPPRPAAALLATALLAPTLPAQGAALLVGMEPDGAETVVHAITPGPFAAVPLVTLPAKLSSASRIPIAPAFSFTGGWDDGGNLYHVLPNGTFVLAGPTGYGALPALAWDQTGVTLWGVTGGFVETELVLVDWQTGAATEVGTTGATGIEAIAVRPGTGTLYGTTGYHYDGSPGDVLTLDRETGLATDTGLDLVDAQGDGPACSVSGLSFSTDGSVGYASLGCGRWGVGSGTLYRFDPSSFVLTELGPVTGGGSLSGLEVVF